MVLPTESAMALIGVQARKMGVYLTKFVSNRQVMTEQKWDFSIVAPKDLKMVLTRIIEVLYARGRIIYYLTQGHLFETLIPQWYVEENFSWRANVLRGKSDEEVERELSKYWLPDLLEGVAERFCRVLINDFPDIPIPPLRPDVMLKLEKLANDLLAATLIDTAMTKATDTRLTSIGKNTVRKLLLPAFLERMKSALVVDPPLKVCEYELGALDIDLTVPAFSILELKDLRQGKYTNREAYSVLTGDNDESESTDGEDIESDNCVSSQSENDDEDAAAFIQDEHESESQSQSDDEGEEGKEEEDEDDQEGGGDAEDDGDDGEESPRKRKAGTQKGGPPKTVRFADEEED